MRTRHGIEFGQSLNLIWISIQTEHAPEPKSKLNTANVKQMRKSESVHVELTLYCNVACEKLWTLVMGSALAAWDRDGDSMGTWDQETDGGWLIGVQGALAYSWWQGMEVSVDLVSMQPFSQFANSNVLFTPPFMEQIKVMEGSRLCYAVLRCGLLL